MTPLEYVPHYLGEKTEAHVNRVPGLLTLTAKRIPSFSDDNLAKREKRRSSWNGAPPAIDQESGCARDALNGGY